MKRGKLSILLVSVCLLLMLAALPFISACAAPAPAPAPSPSPSPTPAKTIELKIGHMQPPTHFIQALLEEWAKKVEEQTNGRVKSTVYPVATLCPPPETYEALATGIMDVGVAPDGYTPARFTAQMFICESQTGSPSSAVSTRIRTELLGKFPIMLDEFKDSHVLWLTAHGPANVHSNFPVRSLADLKGKTLRSPPGGATDIMKALGANPVAMPMDETYISIEKGIVDGLSVNDEVLKSWKLADVTGYTTILHHYTGPFFCAMNLNTWNSLPPDVQAVITGLNDWGQQEMVKGWDMVDQEGRDYAKTQGHEFIEFTPDQLAEVYALLKPVHAGWAKNLEAKGMPGNEILQELYRLVAEYTK